MATSTMSIDWEDFSQLCSKYEFGKFTEPTQKAIERQTDIMLNLFDETNCKATFFILGKLAAYKPKLVKLIAARGHEIALHGQNHVAMFTLTPEQAKDDIATSQKIVTDIIGAPVYGYRAPFFSIKNENLYLLQSLTELGLTYDSSIFPMELPRYGIPKFPTNDALYILPNGKKIVELPMTIGHFLNKPIPVCGGGYFRLFPGFLLNKIFKCISTQQKDSMIYMHPYEFDSKAIDVSANYPSTATYSKSKVLALNFKWNLFRPSITGKLKSLLQQYNFNTCYEKAELIIQKNDAVPIPILTK